MEPVEITLPIGFVARGKWHRKAKLRALNSVDEDAIRESAKSLLPAQRITYLLLRVLKSLGPEETITLDNVRQLIIGDRDALLLHLRRLTFDDKIQSVISCPLPGCGERMDLELSIENMLVPPNGKTKSFHETVIGENSTDYIAKFRLPTGADQEEAAKLAIHDPDAASELMLRRCIKQVKKGDTKIRINNKLIKVLIRQLPKIMAELDPQAEILLNMTCPVCNQDFVANFDIGDFFWRELMNHTDQLYREVHVLAYHYHWSESEILTMPRSKRHIYLNLLAETLDSGES